MKEDKKTPKGQVLVLLVFFIAGAIGLGGLIVDTGSIYFIRQNLKKTADAAALAGAYELPNESAANQVALEYAARNGITNGSQGNQVTTQVNPTGTNANWFRVTIRRPFNYVFGRIFGLTQTNLTVFSTAQYNTFVPISINLAGVYGDAHPRVTLTIRGKDSPYEHGDPYSSEYLDDGSPNPNFRPEGYSYWLYVPQNYSQINGSSLMKLEIFDPDSYGDYDSTGTRTTTTYTLYRPDSSPRDFSDDVPIASYTKGGDYRTSEKWITPAGFTLDTATYGTGRYRISVKPGSGYNANGFSLRAGPTNKTTFNPENGTQISAIGSLPIRFNDTGQVVIQLGFVPQQAAGTTMHVNKFDTDIGSSQIIYSCNSLSQTWTGELAGNSEWKEDLIEIPSNYSGGTWYATYYAGVRDNSLWNMWYEGMSESETGFAVLVE